MVIFMRHHTDYFRVIPLIYFWYFIPYHATATGGELGDGVPIFLNALAGFIFGPLLTFLLSIAFLLFVWNVIKYFISDVEEDKTAAKKVVLWGIGGFVLILTLFGIVNMLVEFLGLGDETLKYLPTLFDS